MTLPHASARLHQSLMVWCTSCQRVWRRVDLILAPGVSSTFACPLACCNDGTPADLLPYHPLRRLITLRWPKSPTTGQRYPLRPDRSCGEALVSLATPASAGIARAH